MEQTAKDCGQVEAAVEAVLNLGELAMSLFGEVERMVGAREGGLEVTQQGVDREELLEFHAGRAATYHSFDFAKYAHRYLAEVQYRFNRRFDLAAILGRLLHASAATKPTPERRIRAAELRG